MKSSGSRFKKTPVTDGFNDQHHEAIFGWRSPNSLFCCVFGLMEERGALPKHLSTREKAGYPDSGCLLKRRSWAILERRFYALTSNFPNPSFSAERAVDQNHR
jgi:hypothetical protein